MNLNSWSGLAIQNPPRMNRSMMSSDDSVRVREILRMEAYNLNDKVVLEKSPYIKDSALCKYESEFRGKVKSNVGSIGTILYVPKFPDKYYVVGFGDNSKVSVKASCIKHVDANNVMKAQCSICLKFQFISTDWLKNKALTDMESGIEANMEDDSPWVCSKNPRFDRNVSSCKSMSTSMLQGIQHAERCIASQRSWKFDPYRYESPRLDICVKSDCNDVGNDNYISNKVNNYSDFQISTSPNADSDLPILLLPEVKRRYMIERRDHNGIHTYSRIYNRKELITNTGTASFMIVNKKLGSGLSILDNKNNKKGSSKIRHILTKQVVKQSTKHQISAKVVNPDGK